MKRVHNLYFLRILEIGLRRAVAPPRANGPACHVGCSGRSIVIVQAACGTNVLFAAKGKTAPAAFLWAKQQS